MGTAIDMAFDGATLAACPLSALVLSFAFYGFCGWAWESTVCAMLNHGRFANSGFLLGPCCPIYGVGGIACWLLLRGIPDASSQFVAAALVCSVIEYSVGLLLEKTTGARFWDYSHLPFNLHGRICLYWACAFGLGALCICRLVEPALLGLLGHLPVLIVRLSAFIVAVAMMVDAVCSLASWRRLSDELERVRADLADRINESLADASDSMLERIPDSAIDSVAQTHIRGRAVNAWLAELGDAALDALREKASMPTFISDGARGLALAARRVADAAPSMPRPSLSRRLAGKRMSRPVPSVSLSRRDLRFFNAFPRLRINRYEGVIRATDLRDRARELFRRYPERGQARPSRSHVSRSFRARCRAVSKIAAPFPFDNAAFNNAVSGLHQLPLGRIMGADNVHATKGERMYDTGSTTFMLICTMLVFLMTPGLAFFYGGLSRRKNVINTMLMCFGAIGLVGVLWIVAGWSLAYGGDGSSPFIGGLDQLLCLPVFNQVLQAAEGNAADGAVYPQIINIAFQMAFAMITAAIVTGSLAGRVKFGAMTAFLGIWLLVVYAPLAHMVWGGDGSFIGDIIGALDFAGGDVVHISSGLTGLILCLILGRRRGFGMVSYRPHNVPFVALGAGLLWFGWFGFNGGSEFKADAVAALAILNTVTASAAGMVSWLAVERVHTGRPTLVGASTGLVAGLVVVTPGAGFVEPWAALVMGLIVSPVCYLAISHLKTKCGYDDALDAFGCHGIGGILGGVLTGLFCVPELSWTGKGGLFYTGDVSLLISQVLGIVVTVAIVLVLDLAIAAVVKALFHGSLRVDEADEALGLDASQHGESAYPSFSGLD